MADCCDPIVPPANCIPRCNPYVSTDCVVDPTGYSCLGIEAESTQSEINAAIIEKLCAIEPPDAGCPVFENIDLEPDWTTPIAETDIAQNSDPIGCVVRLRGTASQEFDEFVGDNGCHRYQMIITNNIPVAQRPVNTKVLTTSVNVQRTQEPGTDTATKQYIASIFITPAGQMVLSFYLDRCVYGTEIGVTYTYTATVLLDGLTYETN